MSRSRCHEIHHMTMNEFSLYRTVQERSRESEVFELNGREVAKEYAGVSKNLVYRTIKQLVEKGWLEEVDGPARGYWGFFAGKRYKLVKHSEWAKRHPGQCRELENYQPVELTAEQREELEIYGITTA